MLPREFKPTVKTNLVRVGSQYDGGYVVAEESLKDSAVIYGFGVNTDWTFEEDFKRRTNAEVVCFDHTVNFRFWRHMISRNFRRLLLLNPIHFFSTIKLIWSYRRFFNGKNATHHQKMIGPEKMGGVDLHQLVKGKTQRNVFFKVDIEGWEYRILDQLIAYQDVMTGLIIEFHDVDLHREKIVDFIRKTNLVLVHVHGNNCAGTDVNGDPIVLEMTFKPKSANDKPIAEVSLPLAGYDFPNNRKVADYQLSFS